jgi:outer membrane protein OmpA-like peptidoglycan-associated protein
MQVMRSSILTFGIVFTFFSISLLAQDEPIMLVNPSFEGTAQEGTINGALPTGWYDCGFPGESVPDIHPKEGEGAFKVNKAPYHGNTYLGMVVRENDTWEMVSQRLSAPLKGGKCYEFSIHLCRSEMYVSPGRLDSELKNYATPVKLRIWGGNGYCNRAELLAESSLIVNTRWLEYNFRFEPKQNYGYIVLEAFYKTPTPFPYNGNILMDNATPIIPVPCLIEKPTVPEKPADEIVNATPKPTPNSPAPPSAKNDASPSKGPKILKELERSKITKGQTIRIDQLYFQADSSRITMKSYPVLDEIHGFLSDNPDVIVEIGGHTNGIPPSDYCDKLSTARAKAVAEYLVSKGISRERLQFKGYGKSKLIASDKTDAGRKKNQRVEIKILSFNG